VATVSYYQTTRLSAGKRQEYESAAQNQEAAVLDYFRQRPGAKCSPDIVHKYVLPRAPLTSVRRALTNLTQAGHLVRLDEHQPGRYGRLVHLWQLAQPKPKPAEQSGPATQLNLFDTGATYE
jgi:hypothetical protein